MALSRTNSREKCDFMSRVKCAARAGGPGRMSGFSNGIPDLFDIGLVSGGRRPLGADFLRGKFAVGVFVELLE